MPLVACTPPILVGAFHEDAAGGVEQLAQTHAESMAQGSVESLRRAVTTPASNLSATRA